MSSNGRPPNAVRRGLLAWGSLGATGLAWAEPAAEPGSEKAPVLDNVPADASLGQTLDGQRIKLSDHAGKVVVVSFWASWCAPCRAEFPYLDRLQEVGGERLKVVSVNIEERKVFVRLHRALSEQVKLTLTYDPDKACATAFKRPSSIPYTVVLKRDHSVAGISTGWGGTQHLVDLVNQAMA
ncbi:MAG: hypothetical protein DI603_21830 [Roseateles depolymerans]|uniref:Thioredoxin domain-containing protein n=1 Tax=Roseateles depolymerans TaxID=76731 RepID=A0A2W5F4L8_9BURK|nr:MAG: hypothetical protein DI603_21830 [Roseateles depolymerans]